MNWFLLGLHSTFGLLWGNSWNIEEEVHVSTRHWESSTHKRTCYQAWYSWDPHGGRESTPIAVSWYWAHLSTIHPIKKTTWHFNLFRCKLFINIQLLLNPFLIHYWYKYIFYSLVYIKNIFFIFSRGRRNSSAVTSTGWSSRGSEFNPSNHMATHNHL